MAATLRGTLVEAEQSAGTEEIVDFRLEDVTFVEPNPEGPADLETTAVNLIMHSAVSDENWVGKEVVVEGRFDIPPSEDDTSRWVFVVEHIEEA